LTATWPEGDFAADLARHFGRSVGIRVSDIYTHFNHAPAQFDADLATVVSLFRQDLLKPVVHEVLPLEEAAHAHALLESGRVQGKLVLAID
jgi:NADPH2:quinone reductase